jgi:hypothetical protein
MNDSPKEYFSIKFREGSHGFFLLFEGDKSESFCFAVVFFWEFDFGDVSVFVKGFLEIGLL